MAEILAESRVSSGFSQRELSKKLGRPHNYLYLVERGDRPLNVCEFIEIAHLLGANPAELMVVSQFEPVGVVCQPCWPELVPMKITNQEFVNDDVEIDGNSFEGCTFRKCKMIFRARAGVSMSQCGFFDVEWVFLDSAQLTASFLRVLTDGGGDYGRSLLVNTFPALREWIKAECLAKLEAPVKS
jgi:transcriptional regulator with XRE-family HTH domain